MRNLVFALVGITIVLSSCDKVDDPFEGIASSGGDLVGDTTYSDTSTVIRKIYAEEFTGHTCQNCPQNSERLVEWSVTDYNKQLVIVAIHFGNFAEPQESKGLPADWRVAAGQEIHDMIGVSIYPTATFNRLQTGSLLPGLWQSELADVAQTISSPTIQLMMRNIRNEELNENLITIRGRALTDLSGDHTLGIMVVEDSIIAPQIDQRREIQGDDPLDIDYVHRHMLRGSIGPSAGNGFITGSLSNGEEVEVTYKYEPTDDQNPKHLIFVAFVRNSDTGEIIQVEEIHAVGAH